MNKNILIIVGVLLIAIVVGGFVWYLNTREQTTKQPAVTTSPQATSGADTAKEEKPEVIVESVKLEAVGGYTGGGTATRSFDGSIFTHTVTADIGDPAQGKFYEGWLVDKSPTLKFFSTGKMVKEGNKYTLKFTAKKDHPDYPDVVITEETEANGLDGNPETHVLEGSFK
jgi:uncharacterized protein YxeA